MKPNAGTQNIHSQKPGPGPSPGLRGQPAARRKGEATLLFFPGRQSPVPPTSWGHSSESVFSCLSEIRPWALMVSLPQKASRSPTVAPGPVGTFQLHFPHADALGLLCYSRLLEGAASNLSVLTRWVPTIPTNLPASTGQWPAQVEHKEQPPFP